VKVIVLTSQNVLPVADAGPNRTVPHQTSSVNLDGSGSNDPDDRLASWTLISVGIRDDNSNTAKPSVTGLILDYTIQLKVTDNNGASTTDQMIITVNPSPTLPNQSPVANVPELIQRSPSLQTLSRSM
jgi:hypothetical protein